MNPARADLDPVLGNNARDIPPGVGGAANAGARVPANAGADVGAGVGAGAGAGAGVGVGADTHANRIRIARYGLWVQMLQQANSGFGVAIRDAVVAGWLLEALQQLQAGIANADTLRLITDAKNRLLQIQDLEVREDVEDGKDDADGEDDVNADESKDDENAVLVDVDGNAARGSMHADAAVDDVRLTPETLARYVHVIMEGSEFARLYRVVNWLTRRSASASGRSSVVGLAHSIYNAMKPYFGDLLNPYYKSWCKGRIDPVIELLRVLVNVLLVDSSHDGQSAGGQALISLLLLHASHPQRHFRLGINEYSKLGPRLIVHAAMEMGSITSEDVYLVLLALLWHLDEDYVTNPLLSRPLEFVAWSAEMHDLAATRLEGHVGQAVSAIVNQEVADRSCKMQLIVASARQFRRQALTRMAITRHEIEAFVRGVAAIRPERMSMRVRGYIAEMTAIAKIIVRPEIELALRDADTNRICKLGVRFLDSYVLLAVAPFASNPAFRSTEHALAVLLAQLLSSEWWDETCLAQASLWKHKEWCPALFSHRIPEPGLTTLDDSQLLMRLFGRSRARHMADIHTGFADAVREQLGDARLERVMSSPAPPVVDSLRQELRWSGLRNLFIAGLVRQVKSEERGHAIAADAGSNDSSSSVADDDKRRRRHDPGDDDLAF
jgi:hypothetical protein